MAPIRPAAVAVARLRAASAELPMMGPRQHLGLFHDARMNDLPFQQEYQRVRSQQTIVINDGVPGDRAMPRIARATMAVTNRNAAT
jgi:hypothetical protein